MADRRRNMSAKEKKKPTNDARPSSTFVLDSNDSPHAIRPKKHRHGKGRGHVSKFVADEKPLQAHSTLTIELVLFIITLSIWFWLVQSLYVYVYLFPLSTEPLINVIGTFALLATIIVGGALHFRFPNILKVSILAVTLFALEQIRRGAFTPFSTVAFVFWVYMTFWRFFDPYHGHESKAKPWVQRLRIWQDIANHYFPVTIIREASGPLDPKQQYLFLYSPHGVWPWGLLMSFISEQFQHLFPGLEWRVLVASNLLMLPYAAEWLMGMGCVDATHARAKSVIESGKSPIIVPGGLKEGFLSSKGVHQTALKGRRGFVKIALMNNIPLVPCYGFGETSFYTQFNPWRAFRLAFTRITGVPLIFFVGRYNLTMVPKRRPYTMVIGEPIHLGHVPHPTKEDLDRGYEQYEKALIELFNKYRRDDDGELRILDARHI